MALPSGRRCHSTLGESGIAVLLLALWFALVPGAVKRREQQIGGSGGSLEPPWASFLNPLGLFLRTPIPFV